LTGPDLPVLRLLELYLGIFNSSNQNKRKDDGRTDPEVILALGDVGFGLRGAGEVVKGLNLGGNLGVRFFNSISGVAAKLDATNVLIDLLATFDVRKFAPVVPLRAHLNFGYQVDNSLNLLPPNQCSRSQSNDPCIRSRVVETFAYGLGVSRVRFALALEAPIRPHVPWGIFGIAPFIEYHLEHGVGNGDTTVAGALDRDPKVSANPDRIHNQNLQYLTLGLRLRPVVGLVFDLGIDVGLQSPGFQYGPPLPAWNFLIGAAYSYDPSGPATKIVKRTVTRSYEVNRTPPEGRVRGVVRDAKTRRALAGAIVKYTTGRTLTPQATAEDGTFVSYGLPGGALTVEVSRDDYQPATVNVVTEPGAETPVEVMLTARPPRESKVILKVTDEKGAPVVGGAARFNGPVARDGAPESDGFAATLPAGDYTVSIDAPGFLAKEKQITVSTGKDRIVEMTVHRRPAQSHVALTKDAIVIKGTIHFGTSNAAILPDGQQLLDEVVDVLAKNHQIRRMIVEGHTDNRGAAEVNLKLSKTRAAAVVDYLAKQGIEPSRLSSEGYGAARPLVPNLTPANRARNRRVDFKIVDQGAGFAQ
jgi:outer membrane protein OmpA-like peptidoglycan-associated protein